MFEINSNASNRVEQGCRAQMSGTRKLKTGSHLAGSKKNDIFLRQQVGQWNYYGQIMTNHTVCRSICSQVPWSGLWKVAVAMHWQCKDARKTQWVWKCMQHAAKHPSTQTSKPFAAGISFLILFDIHHNAVRVVIHETSSSWNHSIDVWKRENRKITTNRETNPSLMPIHLSKSSLFLKPPWDPVTHERESWMMMRGVSRVVIYFSRF